MTRLFHNRMTVLGLLLAGGLIALALLAPVLPLPGPDETRLDQRLLPPGTSLHLLGTDHLGRDMLSRLLWGTRLSIAVAAAATLLAAVLGSLIGMTAAYCGRWIDALLMRSMDVALAFPYLILALAIVAILGPGLVNALLAIAIVNIPFFARTTRAVTLGLTRQSFIESARMSGQGHISILGRELLPNVLPTIVIAASTTFGWMILETAGLSFLGLGAQPPRADLGSMLADSRTLMLVAPHTGLLPGLVILTLVLGLNLVGDGVRDVLDPKLRGVHRPLDRTRVNAPAASINPNTTTNHDAPGSLRIDGLEIVFETGRNQTAPGVEQVNLEIKPGEALGIVGESGSGKTITAMSILRLVASPPAVILNGRISFDGTDLLTLDAEPLRQIRGRRIGVIFQDPLGSLNPLETIGYQLEEAIFTHQPLPPTAIRERCLDLLRQVHLPDPEMRLRQYPHQLSGGQRQRVAIAMALANQPELIIADEPTTALDLTVQRSLLERLQIERKRRGASLLFISHDLAVVRAMCDRLVVMKDGRVVETGPVDQVIIQPQHDYTRHLLSCTPKLDPASIPPTADAPDSPASAPLLRATGLHRDFSTGRSRWFRSTRLTAVDNVDLQLAGGDCLGLVGGSGSGKTTLIRMLGGLLPIGGGEVHWRDRPLAEWMQAPHRREFHRQVQFVFQDPRSAFNPRRRIGDMLATPLRCLTDLSATERRQRIRQTLTQCQIEEDVIERYPHEFSGGQAQRIAIARALVTRPQLLLLDEPLSALDVSVQQRILKLLRDLRGQLDLTMVLVSHDLAVVADFCDRIAVMHQGKVIETGPTHRVLSSPSHAVTRELIDSIYSL